MGKVSPVSTKYIIYTEIGIEGSVDRPDVIGAIFGQTEGFLGQELELRELQRSGKVGRIEVKLESINGKSVGQIIIPCSLDKTETAIIAAALETIERIGPCVSKVRVEKIEDVRVSKREFVIARAKELLLNLQANVLPDSQEITEEVSQAVRMQEIGSWGPENLPAGPAVEESEEIILVEGRADVLTLLKNGFKNAIAINGTSIPETIKGLCKQKTVTAFVDGDRGGDIILKELMDSTEVDYITKAPAGKEVEELTKKEIHLCLRARIATEQFKFEVSGAKKPQQITTESFRRPMNREQQPQAPQQQNNYARPMNREQQPQAPQQMPTATVEKKGLEIFKTLLDDLVGTRGASLIDKDYKILGKVPTRELEITLRNVNNAFAVVLDGNITKEIAKAAEMSNVSFIVGTTSKLRPNETKVAILIPKDLEKV